MIDEDRPTDLLYVAAIGAEAFDFGGVSRDRMFGAIEALELADRAESDRWAAFVPESGTRKASDPEAGAILEQAESRLRELGVRYFEDAGARHEFQMIVSVVHGLDLVASEGIGRWYSEFIVREEPDPAQGRKFSSMHGVAGLALGRFVRLIVPLADRHRGFRFNTIEVFEAGLAMRWHHIKPEPDYDGKREWPSDEREKLVSDFDFEARLTDDIGTEYSSSLGGSSWTRWEDGSIAGHGIDVRTPAPPTAAKSLTYRQDDFELTIPIARNG